MSAEAASSSSLSKGLNAECRDVLGKWLINYQLYYLTLKSQEKSEPASDAKKWTLAEQKKQLEATTAYVKDRATKFTVAFDGDVDRQDAEPFADMLLRGLVSLLAAYQQVCLYSSQCKQKLLEKYVLDVFESCGRLVKAFAERHRRADDKVPPSLTGQVWAKCDALMQMPLDDRQLMYKKIGQELRVLKDAMAEVKESAESTVADAKQRKIEAVLASASVQLTEDDVMWLGGDEELTDEERARMAHLLKIVRLSCVLVDKVNRQLVHERNSAELTDDVVAFVEPFLLMSKRLSARVDDLVIAFEPPHERAEIEPALAALRRAAADMIDVALEHEHSPARTDEERRKTFTLIQTMYETTSVQLLESI